MVHLQDLRAAFRVSGVSDKKQIWLRCERQEGIPVVRREMRAMKRAPSSLLLLEDSLHANRSSLTSF